MRPGSERDVAVVIITRNRRPRLLDTVARMTALPERPPIIVVDNASTDGTAAALRSAAPDVNVIEWPVNLAAGARNIGAAMAATRFVAFCDDDTWWEPGSVARAAERLASDPRLAIVTGRVVVEPSGRTDPTCTVMANSALPRPPNLAGRPVIGFLAGASMVRSSAFWAVGGFDARFKIGAEEHLMAIDLWTQGKVVAYQPDVVVHHDPHTRSDNLQRLALLRRNQLWCAWLRYERSLAVRESVHLLRRAGRERTVAPVLFGALRGLPWVLRERAPLPAGVNAMVRLAHTDSAADPVSPAPLRSIEQRPPPPSRNGATASG